MIDMAKIRKYRELIERASQQMDIPAEEVDELKWMLPPYEVGKEYHAGNRFIFNGEPYQVRDVPDFVSQEDWSPDTTYALYERIARPEETGDEDAPIAYAIGMEIFAGKMYTDADVTYRCTRDSGAPLYHPLAQLVGHYVEVVE